MRRCLRIAAFAVLMAMTLAASIAEAANTVALGIRTGQNAGMTRLVIDLTDRVDYQVFTLNNPYRIVVDLKDAEWLADARHGRKTGLISDMRFGVKEDGGVRLVVDLGRPAEVKRSFILPPSGTAQHRLVLDLAETSREKFVASNRQDDAPTGPVPRTKPRRKTIVIDPGHGGKDPGAISVSKKYEKHIVLAFSQRLRDALNATGRYNAILTRTGDRFIRLRNRVDLARQKDADLFLSIHADASPNRSARGASVYTLSERASDKEAAALAAKENKADLIGGIDLNVEDTEVATILIDLARRETMDYSKRFANGLTDELARVTPMVARSHRFAGFAVLTAPDIPSVLIELGHLSNRTDEKLLLSRAHHRKVSKAIIKAIDGWFDTDALAQR
jgi:N-acetylmuramoyl-L-alanine amidase